MRRQCDACLVLLEPLNSSLIADMGLYYHNRQLTKSCGRHKERLMSFCRDVGGDGFWGLGFNFSKGTALKEAFRI
jgi:hypothetical protein